MTLRLSPFHVDIHYKGEELSHTTISLEGPTIREANLRQYDSLLGEEVPTDDDYDNDDGHPE